MRQGIWNDSQSSATGMAGCYELRGKTLGIVGYGHIGAQVSVLAEAFGLHVLFHDVLNLMPFGSACQVRSLDALLAEADFLTLYMPDTPDTVDMTSRPQLATMKKGSHIINTSGGKVVNIPALIDALNSGHLAGASLDVFPIELSTPPSSEETKLQEFTLRSADDDNNDTNSFTWATARKLQSMQNVILTPHISGSTEDAQRTMSHNVIQALTQHLIQQRSASRTPATALGDIFISKDPHASNHMIQQRVLSSRYDIVSVEKSGSNQKGGEPASSDLYTNRQQLVYC
jgi:D-3-phosphoglycerate dehydrogenase / 2-oxoglutarate reductase